MRSSVAVCLIVCGTLFALMPVASDYYHGYQVSQFLSDRTIQSGVTRIHQPFGETYRAAAWVMGGVMIALGALGGSRAPHVGPQTSEVPEFGRGMLVTGPEFSPRSHTEFTERRTDQWLGVVDFQIPIHILPSVH